MTSIDVTAAELAALRAEAEALMVDTCSVKYVTGTTFDEDTGREVPTYADRIASTPCKVQMRELQSVERLSGGHEATLVRLMVHLPISAVAVEVDDIITITAAVHDSQLVGREFRVLAPVGKSFATARRLEVEEVVA